MALPLSILDLVPLSGRTGEGAAASQAGQAIRDSISLAREADRMGYSRIWFAEHHNMPTVASTTPEILIALAAEATERIRVGSGGVMLPNHAPLKVAEAFKMLEALHPGRIDLGIGRAPGTDAATAIALRGSRQALSVDDFPDQLMDLLDFGAADSAQSGGARRPVAAIPHGVALPPVYLLGSSEFGAQMAAMMGMGYAFAAHFSDLAPAGPMMAYRTLFRPVRLPAPHAILTLSVICAPTDEEAVHLRSSLLVAFARLRTGQPSLLLPPDEAEEYTLNPLERDVVEMIRDRHIAGSPETVKRRIDAAVRDTQADEVMISTFTYGHAERVRSYRLIAEAFGLDAAERMAA